MINLKELSKDDLLDEIMSLEIYFDNCSKNLEGVSSKDVLRLRAFREELSARGF